jgi:hypothetical protein
MTTPKDFEHITVRLPRHGSNHSITDAEVLSKTVNKQMIKQGIHERPSSVHQKNGTVIMTFKESKKTLTLSW